MFALELNLVFTSLIPGEDFLSLLPRMAKGMRSTMGARARGRSRRRRGNVPRDSNVPRRVVSLGTIVPDRVLVAMPYGEMIERTPGAATDFYTFNLNSTFDPDRTGVGHQPLGRDQFAGVLYNRYRVHSVSIQVSFSNIMAAATPCLHYLYLSNGYNLSSITDALEQPYTFTFVQGDPNYGFPGKLKASVNIWDLWGKTKEQYLSDDTTAALFGASPSEAFTADIGLGSMDRTTNISKWRFAIRLVYTVEWFDRVLINAS